MAYKKEDMIAACLKAIEEHKLVFIEDIMAYVSFNRATFYNRGLDKIDTIKEALEKNKINMKNGLRAKWYKGTNALTQIALYKLIGTEAEADRLNASKQKHEHTGKDGERLLPQIVVIDNKTATEVDKLINGDDKGIQPKH